MELKGSAAIVTGGTGGLGRRICLALAKSGANVSLVYLKSQSAAESYAAELSSEFGIKAVAVQADVTTQEGIDKMLAETLAAFGRVDSLVLDAAFNRWIPFKDLETLDAEAWNYIMDYNLTAPFLAMRTIGPVMKKQGQGRIVNITSIAGYTPTGSSIAYSVSKSALNHLSKCMAVALAPEVCVNAVAPGLMEGTRMTANLDPNYVAVSRTSSLLEHAAEKDDVADAVVTFLRTDSITGQTLIVDSGKFFH